MYLFTSLAKRHYFENTLKSLINTYKYLNGLSPDVMSTIFKLRQNTYNLRNFHAFESQNPRTKTFGLDSNALLHMELASFGKKIRKKEEFQPHF